MTEEVLPGLYRLQVPLPQNPLGAVNSYVVKAPERFLVIDTGMNREECITALAAGLKELEVDLNRTDFFVTHMHSDHSGLVAALATRTSRLYSSRADADFINWADPGLWERNAAYAGINGFPENELERAIRNHPGFKYSSREHLSFHFVRDGDSIDVGDYRFECIETPGHTPGHMCLYERDKKLFLSGDHVLFDITPNISLFSASENPLRQYLASLDRVCNLDVRLVLPGHRGFSSDLKRRITELKIHHENRANEVLGILQQGKQSAYEIASKMTWDMSYEFWSDFPVMQQWFATGEAIAHLKYLEDGGRVRKLSKQGRLVYSLA